MPATLILRTAQNEQQVIRGHIKGSKAANMVSPSVSMLKDVTLIFPVEVQGLDGVTGRFKVYHPGRIKMYHPRG